MSYKKNNVDDKNKFKKQSGVHKYRITQIDRENMLQIKQGLCYKYCTHSRVIFLKIFQGSVNKFLCGLGKTVIKKKLNLYSTRWWSKKINANSGRKYNMVAISWKKQQQKENIPTVQNENGT